MHHYPCPTQYDIDAKGHGTRGLSIVQIGREIVKGQATGRITKRNDMVERTITFNYRCTRCWDMPASYDANGQPNVLRPFKGREVKVTG